MRNDKMEMRPLKMGWLSNSLWSRTKCLQSHILLACQNCSMQFLESKDETLN